MTALMWQEASSSGPDDLRFTCQPHPDFKADLAATPHAPGVLLVIGRGMRSSASVPEYRETHPDFPTARAVAQQMYEDWQRDYARDPGPTRHASGPPSAAGQNPADVLAQLNQTQPAPEPEGGE